VIRLPELASRLAPMPRLTMERRAKNFGRSAKCSPGSPHESFGLSLAKIVVHPSGRDPLAGACVMSSSTTIARAVCMLRLKK
jgi:hypothetical protein